MHVSTGTIILAYSIIMLGFLLLTVTRRMRYAGATGFIGSLLLFTSLTRSMTHDIHGSHLFMLPGMAFIIASMLITLATTTYSWRKRSQ
jgi:hypothetical protein